MYRNMKLTIFYDSQCPLCLAEMQQLSAYDVKNRLQFIDLHKDDFSQHYPYINKEYANRILHGQLDTGEVLLGLDVTCRAWLIVGKHKWLKVLRWPLLRNLADAIYLLFARYRYGISYMLTGKARCTSSCLMQNLK